MSSASLKAHTLHHTNSFMKIPALLLVCVSLALSVFLRADEPQSVPAEKAEPVPPAAIAYYEKAWQEQDDAVRVGLLKQALTAEALYQDPSAKVNGPAAVSAIIAKVFKDFPQISIVRSTKIDAYGTSFRYGWQMVALDGKVVLEGVDYGELAPDGRIASIIGFWGPLAPLKDERGR